MDLDLSDDQVALRDGIASMLDGRFADRPRPRRLRPRDVRRAGRGRRVLAARRRVLVGRLRRRVRAARPVLRARARSSRRCCSATAGSPASSIDADPLWIEHLDALDVLVVLVGPGRVRASTRARSTREPSPWPLDPCTPVARVDALPGGRRRSTSTRPSVRRAGAALTAALQLGLADRLHRARRRVREGARAVRPPDRLVPGDQAPAAPTCSRAPRSRGPRCTARARTSTRRRPRRRRLDRLVSRRQGRGRRRRDRERQGRDAGVRRHGLHVGGRRAPLPEAGVGARHALRLGRRARRRRCATAGARRPANPDATVRSHDAAADHRARGARAAPRVRSRRSVPRLRQRRRRERRVHRPRDGRGVDPARAHARRRSASATATASRRCSTTGPSRS